MADAAQQMQDQLDKLQQAANDGALAQADQGDQGGEGGDGKGNDAGGGENAGNQQPGGQGAGGQFAKGDPNANKGGPGGQGGAAVANGGRRPDAQESPFGTQIVKAPSQTDPNGKILASTFVKAVSKKGESTLAQKEVIDSAEKEAADEVIQDRISRPAQNAVKKYFDNLKEGMNQAQPAQ